MNSTSRRWPAGVAAAVLVVAAFIAACGVGAAVWGSLALAGAQSASAEASVRLVLAQEAKDIAQADSDARAKAERERKAEQRKRQAAEAAERDRDERLAGEGFQPAGSGVYFQWVPNGQFSCGLWDCAAVWLIAAEGCPTSLYIEAAIMQGDSQIGFTNELTTALPEWGKASVMFEDHTENGDGFRVTKVNCY